MKKDALAADRTDVMFRAFSDRTRLRLLSLLRGGEWCVGELVEALGIEQPSVSRHLAYLRDAGLVTVRRSAQWSYYALAPAQGEFHAKLLECLGCCFSEVPQLRADQERAAVVRRTGGCCTPPGKATPAPDADRPGCCPGG